MAEIMGYSAIIAPQATNCSAPDTGNMGKLSCIIFIESIADKAEVLARFGTKAQKEKYLLPLLSGETRSSFSMTELGGTSLTPTLHLIQS
jgi:acyl-CoA dehydrogenase